MQFFGEPWGRDVFGSAGEVPVPVGAVCLGCGELVDEDDSGVLMPALHGTGEWRVEALHVECHLRAVLGCVAHLERRCSCYGGSEHGGYSREEARRVMAWVRARRLDG